MTNKTSTLTQSTLTTCLTNRNGEIMEITNLQLFAIAVICLAVIVYFIWHSESVERIAFLAREREAEKKQKERDDDAREHRRMVHEADSKPVSMEPFCGEGRKP